MSVTKTPWFVLNSPELGKPFQEFYEACKEQGVLDKKNQRAANDNTGLCFSMSELCRGAYTGSARCRSQQGGDN